MRASRPAGKDWGLLIKCSARTARSDTILPPVYSCYDDLPAMIGKTLKSYRILEKLGAGGQGTVYKAIDTKLGRNVVIKVLPPELTAKEANLKRFEREARLASSLDHPNICTIYDLDDIDGVRYIAMQYVTGKNVRQLVSVPPLALRSALSIT